MHTLNLIFRDQDEKIVRTAEQIAVGTTIGEQIAALLQPALTEMGAVIAQGKPYEKKNGTSVTPYSVQGVINMPALTFDDGSGDKQTYNWVLNFRAAIPVDGERAPAAAEAIPVVRAMTIAEARKLAAQGHK